MRESEVEKYLVECVEALGGLCEKHVSPGLRGVPDRLVTWPNGAMHLVEVKAQTGFGKVMPWQKRDHERRAKRNVFVYVLHTTELVDQYIAACRGLWA